jgi:hypothetical protein
MVPRWEVWSGVDVLAIIVIDGAASFRRIKTHRKRLPGDFQLRQVTVITPMHGRYHPSFSLNCPVKAQFSLTFC